MTNREITGRLLELEQRKQLFKWCVDGVYPWEFIRFRIFETVLYSNEKKESGSQPLSGQAAKMLKRMKRVANAFVSHPYFYNKPCDVIVFESSRKLMFGGDYIDPYTKFTVDELKQSGRSVGIYQSSYTYDCLAKHRPGVKHLDLVYMISSARSSAKPVKFDSGQEKFMNELGTDLQNIFHIPFNIIALVKQNLGMFHANYAFFDSLFRKRKPAEIYLVNFCDKPALIAAARKNGIVVNDIQHGFISSDDIIYHYPGVEEGSLHYFPDRFFAWDPIWAKICKFPIPPKNVVNYGNKYLINQRSKYSREMKNPNQLLVVSQPGLTRQIASEVLRHIGSLGGISIEYKLHPKEYTDEHLFTELAQLRSFANVRFVAQHEDLHARLAASAYVTGVYSTVLLEAVDFGCKVMLMDLPGIEMMKPFIDEGYFSMISIGELSASPVNN